MRQRARERGIPICDSWANSFDAFIADMGLRPFGHILDRIDNAKGYEKSNCRWATYKLSTENRRNTIWLTVRGEKMRVADAAQAHRVPASAIYQRLAKGWNEEKAATIPSRKTAQKGAFAS